MKLWRAMKTALLISVGLAGCVGGDPDQRDAPRVPASPQPPPPPVDEPWIPDQGTHILGSGPDVIPNAGSAGYISASVVPTFRTKFTLSLSTAANGANLVASRFTFPGGLETHTGADDWFLNLIMTTSDGGQLKITGMDQVTAADLGFLTVASTATSTRYTLSYRASDGKGGFLDWGDYCNGAGGAIPLRGSYDVNRKHIDPTPASISFACPDGIAYKCSMWGYRSGSFGPSTMDWKYHQACTAAGNARYCGDGHSFTREMTPIRLIDTQVGYGIDDPGAELTHPSPFPGDPDTFYIEAGWNAQGKPICLSKLRWVSLPPNPCPGVIEDPRSVPSDHDSVFFCDEFPISYLFSHGAILVNGSELMDAPLGRWSNGTDVVSTIRGFVVDVDGDGQPDRNGSGSVLPFADAQGHSDYQTYLGSDGMLLRNLPGILDESQMTLLYVQNLNASGDRFLSDTGPGRSDPSFEGYSLKQQVTTDSEGNTISATAFNACKWPSSDMDTRLVGTGSSVNCAFDRSLGYAFQAPAP
jgi:hypothetical protein